MNRLKTVMLLATLTALLLWAGHALAEEAGARLSGNPPVLAKALRKIAAWSWQLQMTASSPATAHLFIINPVAGRGMLRLLSTHPSTEVRIERPPAMTRQGAASGA